MRMHRRPDRTADARRTAMHPSAHRRIQLELDGAHDDVPTGPAVAIADLVRAVLGHSDEHTGRPATVCVTRKGPLLNLSLTDPECSPACLRRSRCLQTVTTHRPADAEDVLLFLDEATGGGVRLHCLLLPSPGAGVGPHAPQPVQIAREVRHERNNKRSRKQGRGGITR